jgi:hypothetical protein
MTPIIDPPISIGIELPASPKSIRYSPGLSLYFLLNVMATLTIAPAKIVAFDIGIASAAT